jgi:hypothetical protein
MGRFLLKLDEPPWHIARVPVGFACIPAWYILLGPEPAAVTLLPFFGGVLLASRVLPMVTRRVLPAPSAVRETWAARREKGRRYDSYQWQKLFAVGVGLALYVIVWREYRQAVIVLTLASLTAGLIATFISRRHSTLTT